MFSRFSTCWDVLCIKKKQQLCKQYKARKVNLNAKIAQNDLYESLKRFTNKHVKRWYFKF